jgi:hypothetical protein
MPPLGYEAVEETPTPTPSTADNIANVKAFSLNSSLV